LLKSKLDWPNKTLQEVASRRDAECVPFLFAQAALDISRVRMAFLSTFAFCVLTALAASNYMAKRVRVFYHDKCFDGACSAALFSRFYRERIRRDAEFIFSGLVHRAGALFDESKFDGDENAIVDFKYSAAPKITWWFDHHESAFLTPADAEHYRRDLAERGAAAHKYYDPDFRSCTKFLATVAARDFGFDQQPMAELVHWADVIDGALYPDAKIAVEMGEPAMKLTMIIEAVQEPDFTPRLIPLLATHSLAAVLAEPFVAAQLPPLVERHRQSMELLRERAQCNDGVVYFDLTDRQMEGYNKFIPYYLHPECVYSVGLSKSSFRTKVSVGSNPWTTRPHDQLVNLAKICERYGGGGHARVGAISFEPNQSEQARKAAQEIVEELRASIRS
jgi:hypothetical protein